MKKAESYLIDANCFITPYRKYYAFDLVPKYWELLAQKSKNGSIVLLDKVKQELDNGGDDLSKWVCRNSQLEVCSINNEKIINVYSDVIQYIRESEFYNSKALTLWSQGDFADPWLIAAAKVKNYILVTFENPSGGLNKNSPSSNPKIPDVADHFGVSTCDLFNMMRQLEIRI